MLLKRGDIYYFRWQIPFKLRAVFGQREIIKSLRTPDKITAQLRATPYFKLIQQIKKASLMEALSQTEFEQLLKQAWKNLNQLIPNRLRQIDADDESLNWAIEYVEALRTCYDPYEERFITSINQWPEAFEQCQVDPFRYTEENQEKILQNVLQLYHQYWASRTSQIIQAQNTPDLPPFPAFLNESIAPASGQRALSEFWEEFASDKTSSGKWTTRKLKEYTTHFNNFLEITGNSGITPNAVGRPTVNTYLTGLQCFPLNRSKKYHGIKLADIQTTEYISSNTANQQLDILKMFFSWLEDEGAISKNAFSKAVIATTKKNYASLDQTDIEELFNLPEHLISKPWHFWIPRIAIYTGARQTEIAQLSISDIKEDVATGIRYFAITDEGEDSRVKSAAAIRRVPIPQTLLINGFMDYVALVIARGYTQLWPDLKPKAADGPMGGYVSTYWTDLKTKHRLPSNPVDFKGQKKVFHSLRRVIINRLWHVEQVDLRLIQTLVGHEPEFGATESYLDTEVALSTLQQVIDKLTIENICWEHPLKLVVQPPKARKNRRSKPI